MLLRSHTTLCCHRGLGPGLGLGLGLWPSLGLELGIGHIITVHVYGKGGGLEIWLHAVFCPCLAM